MYLTYDPRKYYTTDIQELGPTRLTSEKNGIFPTSEHQKDTWSHNDTSVTNKTICKRFCDISTIQNQVAKRQLTLIGKVNLQL